MMCGGRPQLSPRASRPVPPAAEEGGDPERGVAASTRVRCQLDLPLSRRMSGVVGETATGFASRSIGMTPGAMTKPRYRVSADIGGTFTDLVFQDRGDRRHLHRQDPVDAGESRRAPCSKACKTFMPEGAAADFLIHGTTVGLNSVLERKGARVALVTTRNFGDVYAIQGNDRRDIFSIHYRKPKGLIERRDVFVVTERLRADGSVETPIELADLDPLIAAVKAGPLRRGRRLLPPRLSQSRCTRLAARRVPRRSAARDVGHAVAQRLAGVARVRPHLDDDHGGLYRAGDAALPGDADRGARRGARRPRPPHHAVERRRDDRGGGARAPDPDAPLRSGRRQYRRRGGVETRWSGRT